MLSQGQGGAEGQQGPTMNLTRADMVETVEIDDRYVVKGQKG